MTRTLALTLGIIGCRDSTSPAPTADDARADVRILSDTVTYTTTTFLTTRGDVVVLQFKLAVSVTNTGRVPVLYEFCTSSVEKQTNTEWTTAWAPICAAEGAPNGAIVPGQSLVQTVDVSAIISGNSSPKWLAASIAGDIRYVVGIVPVGYSGVIPRRASNSIRLVPKQ